MTRLSSVLIAVLASAAVAVPARAQGPTSAAADSVVAGWLALVSGGAADRAWHEAGPEFRGRVDQSAWREWVAAQRPRLAGLRPRRAVSLAMGRDEPPLPELDWMVATYTSERSAGGRIVERVWAWRTGDEPFRVVNYAAWPDPEAIVHNAYLDPLPYLVAWGGGLVWHGRLLGLRRAEPRAPPPGAGRGTAVANPRTFRRPP